MACLKSELFMMEIFRDTEELSAVQEFKSGRLCPTLRGMCASCQSNTVARGIGHPGVLPKVYCKPCVPASRLSQAAGLFPQKLWHETWSCHLNVLLGWQHFLLNGSFLNIQHPSGCRFFTCTVTSLSALRQ